MRGLLDLSPAADAAMSPEQQADLWSRVRVADVMLTIASVRAGGFFAAIAGQPRPCTAHHDNPYRAGLAALAKLPTAAAA